MNKLVEAYHAYLTNSSKSEKFFLLGFLVSLLVFLGIYFSPRENTGMGPSSEFWIIWIAIVSGVIFFIFFSVVYLRRENNSRNLDI